MGTRQSLRRAALVLLTAALALLVVRLTDRFGGYIQTQARVQSGRVIVIDAGHGDFDPGAVVGGVEEKDINLAIALELRDLFRAGGYTVVMTREDDTTLADKGPRAGVSKKTADTRNRSSLADSFPDAVLLSIHQNAYSDASQHGTQVFYGTKDERSKAIAQAIQTSVQASLQPENEREVKRGTDSIYILVHTEAPTVLVECGFMTNADERAKLLDGEYQKQMAWCIYLGYCEYEKNEDVQWQH